MKYRIEIDASAEDHDADLMEQIAPHIFDRFKGTAVKVSRVQVEHVSNGAVKEPTGPVFDMEGTFRGLCSGVEHDAVVLREALIRLEEEIKAWWDANGVKSSPPIDDLRARMSALGIAITSAEAMAAYLRAQSPAKPVRKRAPSRRRAK